MTNTPRTLAQRRDYENKHRRGLACMTCEDTGEYTTPGGLAMPCPDCELGEWNNTLETWDQMRQESR